MDKWPESKPLPLQTAVKLFKTLYPKNYNNNGYHRNDLRGYKVHFCDASWQFHKLIEASLSMIDATVSSALCHSPRMSFILCPAAPATAPITPPTGPPTAAPTPAPAAAAFSVSDRFGRAWPAQSAKSECVIRQTWKFNSTFSTDRVHCVHSVVVRKW